jgi:hypothetical protein
MDYKKILNAIMWIALIHAGIAAWFGYSLGVITPWIPKIVYALGILNLFVKKK